MTNSSGPTVIDKFKSFEYAVTLGYATKASEDLGIGVNVRYIHSALSPIGTEIEYGNGYFVDGQRRPGPDVPSDEV